MNDWATPTTALVYARIALNLRQRDAMNAALDHLAAHLKNPWVQLMDASIRYQLGEESAASLVTRAIENVDLPVVIRDRWWALVGRRI